MRASLLWFSLFLPLPVYAGVVITEVMYDPPAARDSGHEWVEIMNDGDTVVPAAALRFIEGGVRHRVESAVGDGALSPGEVGVIVQDSDAFLGEYSSYTGDVFRSRFSLRQQGGSGEELGIYSDGVLSLLTYTPDSRADGTGASLHILDGRQVPGPATPGSIAVNPITVFNREVFERLSAVREEVFEPEEEEEVADVVEELEQMVMEEVVASAAVEEEVPVEVVPAREVARAPSPVAAPVAVPVEVLPRTVAVRSSYGMIPMIIVVLLVIIVVELYIIILLLYRRR